MSETIRRAREELELARSMTEQLEQERRALARSLGPGRQVVDPEELRMLAALK